MDLYYRGYETDAPITSAAQHLSAAASRIAVSMVRAVPLLPTSALGELKRIMTVQSLWGLALVFAGWVIAAVATGPIAWAVNALLIGYGVLELGKELAALLRELGDWLRASYLAEQEADLDIAAQHFATALSKGLLTSLEIVLTHRLFRVAEARLVKHFPAPAWLRTQYERALQKREQGTRPTEPSEPNRKAAPTEIETPAQRAQRIAKKTVEVTLSGARYEGMKRAGQEVPLFALLTTGAVLTVGAVTVAALATSPRRGRP